MNESQVRALIAAGRLLQSKAWPGGRVRIEKREGERYPQGIARVITALKEADRHRLRELVAWILEYERFESQTGKDKQVTSGTTVNNVMSEQ